MPTVAHAILAQLAERVTCNLEVPGSIPGDGSRDGSPSLGRFPSGQRGQTVNLLAFAFEGSNPSLPKNLLERGGFFIGGDMREKSNSLEFRFECSRCNNCCGGQPGYVWLSEEDLDTLCKYMQMGRLEFAEMYCRLVDLGSKVTLSLKEKRNFDCIFLGKNGCEVYEARPSQCRTYPLWEHIIKNRESWEKEHAECPGIGRGSLISAAKIQASIQNRRNNPPLDIKFTQGLEHLNHDWRSE